MSREKFQPIPGGESQSESNEVDNPESLERIVVEALVASLPSLNRTRAENEQGTEDDQTTGKPIVSEEDRLVIIDTFILFLTAARNLYSPQRWKNLPGLNLSARMDHGKKLPELIFEAAGGIELRVTLIELLKGAGFRPNNASMLVNRIVENIFELLTNDALDLSIEEVRKIRDQHNQLRQAFDPIPGRQSTDLSHRGHRSKTRLLKDTRKTAFVNMLERNSKLPKK